MHSIPVLTKNPRIRGKYVTIVIKRNGKTEEFERKKIEDSLRNAGVDWLKAKDLAGRITEMEGMRTSEIRLALDRELSNINQGLSQRYLNARRFTVKNSNKKAKGVAILSKNSMDVMKLTTGDTVEVRYRDRIYMMRIEKDDDSISPREIILNEKDMAGLAVIDGSRVIVRKSS
jgi:hypothetical protein